MKGRLASASCLATLLVLAPYLTEPATTADLPEQAPPAVTAAVSLDRTSSWYAYSHGKGLQRYQRGQWVTVRVVDVPARGLFHVTLQTPVATPPSTRPAQRPRWVRVRLMRLPARDGTGNLDVAVSPAVRRWHITHQHTLKGYQGSLAVQLYVPGRGQWHSPYRIVKVAAL